MSTSSTTNNLLLIILTVLLPPAGVAMSEGVTKRFWISLILTLLFFIPGLIYSLYVIFG